MGGSVNVMGSCVSFQIKVQILAFYTDMCMAPYPEMQAHSSLALEGNSEVGKAGLKRCSTSGVYATTF